MKKNLLVGLILLLATHVRASVRTETVAYKCGDATLAGFVVYDDATQDKRPGIVVVHDWFGVGPFAKEKAEQLAQLGYVAFVADIYGKGVRPATREEAAAQAGKFKADRALLRERVNAALDELKKQPRVDGKKLAAIGYCFGGTTALELARSGADIAGVVSFHGGLSTPAPADAKNIKGKVLALHGADDPHVPAEEVAAFQDEMRKAGVDWAMTSYGDAVHSFTNPKAGNNKSTGVAYNEKADRRSWQAMKDFFTEIFAAR